MEGMEKSFSLDPPSRKTSDIERVCSRFDDLSPHAGSKLFGMRTSRSTVTNLSRLILAPEFSGEKLWGQNRAPAGVLAP